MSVLRRTALVALPLIAAFPALRAQPRRGEPQLAIKGYDPVAYFTLGRPTKGDPAISHVWDGGRYQFSSDKHRQMFAAEPAKFAPQFSGHCAAGVSMGMKVEAQPEHWIISNGRLFLFSGAGEPDRMRADSSMARRADANWPKLR